MTTVPPFHAADRRNHRIAAASGAIFILGLIVGWWFVAGLVPPISPTEPPESVAGDYRDGGVLTKLGLMIATASLAFVLPLASALADQMRRMEGGRPILASIQMACATVTTTMVTIAIVLWSVAAYRPDRSPELVQLLNDLAWISFTMPVSAIVLWMLIVGVAILDDHGTPSVFPRWSGYLSLWAAILSVPGYPVILFQSGPFAWNGLLAFWIALVAFVVWFVTLMALTLRAIREEPASRAAA